MTWPLSLQQIMRPRSPNFTPYVSPIQLQMMQDVINALDVSGIVGDGVNDDSPAIATLFNNYLTIPVPRPILYFPGGRKYLLNSTPLPLLSNGGSIVGDGSGRTQFQIGPNYTGSFLFGFSESWMSGSYPQNPPTNGKTLTGPDNTGSTVKGVTIVGSLANTQVTTAIGLYDHNDGAVLEDIRVLFNNGMALSIGETQVKTQGYCRESQFRNFFAFGCGTSLVPAVQIDSTTGTGSDATNELDFHNLTIYGAQGPGLCIRKRDNNSSATRSLRFHSTRVEASGQTVTADNVCIGGNGLGVGDPGQIQYVSFLGLELLNQVAGANGFMVTTGVSAPQPYAIYVAGMNNFTGNAATGINLDSVRLCTIDVLNLGVPSGSNHLTFGTRCGGSVSVRSAGGSFSGWTISGKTTQSVT